MEPKNAPPGLSAGEQSTDGREAEAARTGPLFPEQLLDKFFAWQIGARRRAADLLADAAREGREPTPREQGELRLLGFAVHIATLVTGRPGETPNTASKGVLLLPGRDWLPWAVAELERILEMTYGVPFSLGPGENGPETGPGSPPPPAKEQWDRAAPERARFLQQLYRPERLDLGVLGVLEIFRGKTYQNLLADPCCALHFAGASKERGRGFHSYQVDCLARVVHDTDGGLELAFMRGIKIMMDHYGSHVPQRAYPAGYILAVQAIYDKAPFPAVAGRRIR